VPAGCTPLVSASMRGHHAIVAALVKAGAAVNVRLSQGALSGFSALGMASMKGHHDTVVTLLKAKADVDQEVHGETPLRAAACCGHVAVVRSLLQHCAAIELTGPSLATELSTGPDKVRQCADCLKNWEGMSPQERTVVTTFDWEYFEQPPWHLSRHSEYPMHLRCATVAVVMAINQMLPSETSQIVALFIGAMDAHIRHRHFQF